MAKKTIFDYIKQIYNTKTIPEFDDEFERVYEPYMINRLLSMYETWIPFVEKVNIYNISKKSHFLFLFNSIPQHLAFMSFKGFISTKKDILKDDHKKILCDYFEFGSNDLEYALEFLDNATLNDIYGKYN